jgi:REP element-mobilizing transposase RayT
LVFTLKPAMVFRHKDIRLRHLNYVGTGWFFITVCCANRRKVLITAEFCDWVLDVLRCNAARHALAVHAYCLMPNHAHLLLEGLAPTSDLLQFVRALKMKTSAPPFANTKHGAINRAGSNASTRSLCPRKFCRTT